MKQYHEALELLTNKFSFSSSSEIIEMKKNLNQKLEEQNEMIESNLIIINTQA
jgi:hypothetical protein